MSFSFCAHGTRYVGRLTQNLYAPKTKYAGRGYAQSEFSKTTFRWLPSVLRKSMPDVKAAAGTDATVFLYFLHMVRWSLTIIAALTCVVLIPVDLSYSLSHVKTNTQPDAQGNTTSQQNDQDYLLYVTMNQVSGPRLWAHVTLSYLATLIALTFIFLYYRKVIALRQDFFTSVQYQRSYYSRALMITDIPPQYQSDSGLREALTSAHIPYPLSEVQIGRSMNNLPELMHEQKETVMRLSLIHI